MPGKTSSAGGPAVVKWNDAGNPLDSLLELPTVIDDELEKYEKVGKPEIDDVVNVWFKVYHSLVWLNAAVRSSSTNKVNKEYLGSLECTLPGNSPREFCLDNSYVVPAYDSRELGSQGHIYHDVHTEFKEEFQINVDHVLKGIVDPPNFGSAFVDKVKELFEIAHDETDKPLLQYFLDQFNKLTRVPGSDWETTMENIVKSLNNSIEPLEQSDKNKFRCFAKALTLLEVLVNSEIEHFIKLQDLKPNDSGKPIGSKEWLEVEFKIDFLQSAIAELYQDNNQHQIAQLKVSQETKMIFINTKTFNLIFDRFVSGDSELLNDSEILYDGLEHIILNEFDEENWRKLLWAAYGAVAWKFFDQAKEAVGRVKQILCDEQILVDC